MQEVRCASCGKLLCRGIYTQIEIKCPRCRAMNVLRTVSPQPERRERQIQE
ncbi:Com family DNA-binding transcriptional regulator [Silvimonas soli]|uniref:Com family DNA-binding transcriptional regulator n=1 Tax=Silvimonas soli TaxID=2980100 RepID=UPI0036F27D96